MPFAARALPSAVSANLSGSRLQDHRRRPCSAASACQHFLGPAERLDLRLRVIGT
jgi:hypothetical protein